MHLDFSPIRGPEGNIEYLMHLLRTEQPIERLNVDRIMQEKFAGMIAETVAQAHNVLDAG